VPEAWELRKKDYPTPAKASAQNDSGRETQCRVVKLEKALLDCLAFGGLAPPPHSVHVTEVNLGHKLETFPGG